MQKWLYLLVAILTEVTATSALKASDGFRRPWPSLLVVLGYGLSFYFLSLTLREIPVGVAYAVWSGLGLMLITLAAWLLYGQHLDVPALLGMLLILGGIVVMNVFSRSIAR
jgi:small multidrug resistance pump